MGQLSQGGVSSVVRHAVRHPLDVFAPLAALVGVLSLLLLTGCSTSASNARAPLAEETIEYRIGPEDMLDISVWNEENLHRSVLVLPDGQISFPLAGTLMAAGKTIPELQDSLTQRLRNFVHDARVTVSVEKITGLRIYVLGEVQKPGQYVVGRYVDVLQALSLAGGLTPYAARDDIQVLRRDGTSNAVYRFDYDAARKGKGLERNILLRSNDVVLVP
ncbi:MAG: polysaccharide export protein [Gammaproteobacteria bacterium]|nr:polysaccharide export protein [Gammaproteobacteria bacterium]